MIFEEDDYLEHIGMPRRSGRYPWGTSGWGDGSAENYEKRNKEFFDYYKELKASGMSDGEIATAMGMKTTEFRARRSVAVNADRQHKINEVQKLKDKGVSNSEISRLTGIPEPTVRSYLKPGVESKTSQIVSTAAVVKEAIDSKGMVDIGSGVELHMNVSRNTLNGAVQSLKDQGYKVFYPKIKQLGTGHETSGKVLGPPGSTWADVDITKVQQIFKRMEDGNHFQPIQKPISVSSSKVDIKYGPDGGDDADGLIYLRPGVKDLSLGAKNYAQVRIAVDDTHYIKGMAIYNDDLPAGVNVQFNTNKTNTGNKLDALKPMDPSNNWENPFGSIVTQKGDIQPDGSKKLTSALNIVNEEGDWDAWSRNLPSQLLSKQPVPLAKHQLDQEYLSRKDSFDEIMSLSNPVVRQRLLESFADDADAASVHMKAAQAPRQRTQVILPSNKVKDTEVYAPNFKDGERVVLVRFPHGGRFEIPELTVNNRTPALKKMLPNPDDAVIINAKVAARLSGADFDGDTVLVIPNPRGQFKTANPLKDLEHFNAKREYPPYDGMRTIDGGIYNEKLGRTEYPRGKKNQTTQTEMGKVSNLITDMTIAGAPPSEIARAVKHSMVVIDAPKHSLDYRQSEKANGIALLKKRYQYDEETGGSGAATIISRAKGERSVNKIKPRPMSEGGPVDKKTGKKVFVPDESAPFVDKRSGKTIYPQTRLKKLEGDVDARTLISKHGTKIEQVYAGHSNRMKDLANKARKEAVNTTLPKRNPAARVAYASEVASLERKLVGALMNAPLERQAQIVAGADYEAKKNANPDMDKAQQKKQKALSLEKARRRLGAKKPDFKVTQEEWNAIQAGAVSPTRLQEMLRHADLEEIKKFATPKDRPVMSTAKLQQAKALLANGATQAEVADHLGVSLTTLKTHLNPKP